MDRQRHCGVNAATPAAVAVAALLLTACGTQTGTAEPGWAGTTETTSASAPAVADAGGIAGFPSCEDVEQIRAMTPSTATSRCTATPRPWSRR